MDIRTIMREMAQTFITALLLTFCVMLAEQWMQMPGAKILTDDANMMVMQTTGAIFSRLSHFWWGLPLLLLILGLFYRRSTEKRSKKSKRFTPAIYHDIRYEEYYDADKVKVVKKKVTRRP